MIQIVGGKTLSAGDCASEHKARQAAELSMRALAEKAGVTHTTINDIEKGHHFAATDIVEGLAQALGVRGVGDYKTGDVTCDECGEDFSPNQIAEIEREREKK